MTAGLAPALSRPEPDRRGAGEETVTRAAWLVLAGAVALAVGGGVASAQTAPKVRDAIYRGTLVCAKLPFFEKASREAIEVKIKGSDARYIHVVRERQEMSFEQGTGTLDGEKLTLKGDWTGEDDSYQASYSGTFVRRSAQLSGTQTWQHGGRSYTRTCSGSIKRPFAVFLPGEGKADAKP